MLCDSDICVNFAENAPDIEASIASQDFHVVLGHLSHIFCSITSNNGCFLCAAILPDILLSSLWSLLHVSVQNGMVYSVIYVCVLMHINSIWLHSLPLVNLQLIVTFFSNRNADKHFLFFTWATRISQCLYFLWRRIKLQSLWNNHNIGKTMQAAYNFVSNELMYVTDWVWRDCKKGSVLGQYANADTHVYISMIG